jgi:hypothetical protein
VSTAGRSNLDDFMNLVREAIGKDPIPEKGRTRGTRTWTDSDTSHTANLARFEGDGNYRRTTGGRRAAL